MKASLPRVLLLCNGESPSRGLIRRLSRGTDMFVAADGGANAALAAGVRPDVIIGDMDSIRHSTRKRFSGSRIVRVSRQDNTDLEKALDFIASSGPAEVVIAGAVGGRIDHTLGNLSVFWNYARVLSMTFVGDGWRAFPAGRKSTLSSPRGDDSEPDPVRDLFGDHAQGAPLPLTNAVMRPGEIGVSNVVRRSPFTVSVRRGRMLIVVFDRAQGAGEGSLW